MNVALRKPMTLEQFLAWEDRQELKFEFDGFRPVAMTGGTAAHSAIQRNIIVCRATTPCCACPRSASKSRWRSSISTWS